MNNTTSNNAYINTDPVLQALYQKFGPAVFIPIPKGSYEPKDDTWRQVTFEQTQTTPYLRELSLSSIALVLGKASGQLCCIGFAAVEAVQEFLALNPALKATVVSKRPSGSFVWIRIRGFCPRTQNLMTCAWYSDGWVMVFNRDVFGGKCEINGGPHVIETTFSELIFDSTADKAIFPQVVEALYGSPNVRDEQGRNRLNHSYWGFYFGAETGLKYHAGQKQFLRWNDERDRWLPVHKEIIMMELQQFLFRFGQAGVKGLQNALPGKELRQLLDQLKIVTVGEFPEEVDGLESFLNERIERKKGSDVTSEEMFVAYGCFCQNHRLPALTQHEFTRKLPVLVKEKFGITPGHSLIREGGSRRGYRNVALKKLQTVGTEGTGRTHINKADGENIQGTVL